MELQTKMYNEGSNPPEHLWDAISMQLPDEGNNRLYDLEFDPPATCWNHIHEQISSNQVRIIRFNPSNVLRYAAVLVFAIFTSLVVLNPSFRTNVSNAIQGNKIKAALPPTKLIIDSINNHKRAVNSVGLHK